MRNKKYCFQRDNNDVTIKRHHDNVHKDVTYSELCKNLVAEDDIRVKRTSEEVGFELPKKRKRQKTVAEISAKTSPQITSSPIERTEGTPEQEREVPSVTASSSLNASLNSAESESPATECIISEHPTVSASASTITISSSVCEHSVEATEASTSVASNVSPVKSTSASPPQASTSTTLSSIVPTASFDFNESDPGVSETLSGPKISNVCAPPAIPSTSKGFPVVDISHNSENTLPEEEASSSSRKSIIDDYFPSAPEVDLVEEDNNNDLPQNKCYCCKENKATLDEILMTVKSLKSNSEIGKTKAANEPIVNDIKNVINLQQMTDTVELKITAADEDMSLFIVTCMTCNFLKTGNPGVSVKQALGSSLAAGFFISKEKYNIYKQGNDNQNLSEKKNVVHFSPDCCSPFMFISSRKCINSPGQV